MATPADVNTLHRAMGAQVTLFHQVPQASFNHMDFVWAINVRSLVYDRMVQEMRKYD